MKTDAPGTRSGYTGSPAPATKNKVETVRVRVKYCGLTREQDAHAAAQIGVDAVGMIFYPKSSRHISLQQSLRLKAMLPSWVSVVALFVNPDRREVAAVVEGLKPDYLQFHGDEPESFCLEFDCPYIKAFRVGQQFDWQAAFVHYRSAEALLFDANIEGVYGGSGRSFNWSQYQASGCQQKTIVAGGLCVENVGQAIKICRPDMVDVSGGIEAQPGVKDISKMKGFMKAVLNASLDGS